MPGSTKDISAKLRAEVNALVRKVEDLREQLRRQAEKIEDLRRSARRRGRSDTSSG